MKKFFLPFLTLAVALVSTSCQDENDMPNVPSGDKISYTGDNVVFNIKTPDGAPRTRTQDGNGWYGNGVDAEVLNYAVYEKTASGEISIVTGSTKGGPKPVETADGWTLSLNIPAGIEYRAVFFADAFGATEDDQCAWFVEWDDADIHFTGLPSQGDGSDAFFALFDSETDKSLIGADGINITMRRPFVQMNVISNELDNKVVASKFRNGVTSTMQFMDIDDRIGYPEYWYFLTDEIQFLAQDKYASSCVFPGDETKKVTFNGKQYDLLYMGYYFAPASSTEVDATPDRLEFRFGPKGSTPVSTCQVSLANGATDLFQRNQRVIIYHDASQGGNGFFSAQTNFSIAVDPGFSNQSAVAVD